MLKYLNNNRGFSLIELMVVMAVSGVVMAGVYAAYLSQARSYNTQQLTVDMQENLRVALDLLQMDLRLAGSDLSMQADAGFTAAGPTSFSFSMDIRGGEDDGLDNNKNNLVDEGSNTLDDDGDGLIDEPDEAEWYDGDIDDEGETITWLLNDDNELMRDGRTVATNIQQVNFVYLDKDGNRLDDDDGNVIESLDDIRIVQVTLIGSAGKAEQPFTFKYPDKNTYQNQAGEIILDLSLSPDELRKRMVSSEVYCRNMN